MVFRLQNWISSLSWAIAISSYVAGLEACGPQKCCAESENFLLWPQLPNFHFNSYLWFHFPLNWIWSINNKQMFQINVSTCCFLIIMNHDPDSWSTPHCLKLILWYRLIALSLFLTFRSSSWTSTPGVLYWRCWWLELLHLQPNQQPVCLLAAWPSSSWCRSVSGWGIVCFPRDLPRSLWSACLLLTGLTVIVAAAAGIRQSTSTARATNSVLSSSCSIECSGFLCCEIILESKVNTIVFAVVQESKSEIKVQVIKVCIRVLRIVLQINQVISDRALRNTNIYMD